MTEIERLNAMSEKDATEAFLRCCGASQWATAMTGYRPFADRGAIEAACDSLWSELTTDDWFEAFASHPRIGDGESLRARFATTHTWAEGEQAGTASASEKTLQALATGNDDYFARFGYIFIVCATGKGADEMLSILRARLPNTPDEELPVAAEEQKKITRLRLEKLLTPP